MAIALVTNALATSGVNTSGATSSLNTTGATLLVAVVGSYTGGSEAIVTDSKGNTWTKLTSQNASGGNSRSCIYYAENPTVGTGHTFTANATGAYPAIAVSAFSGAKVSSVFDQQNGTAGSSPSTTISTGSVTPSQNDELIIAGLCNDVTSTFSINQSMTITNSLNWVGTVNMGVASAYKVQTTATAINATWTATGAGVMAATIATFKMEPTGGDGPWYNPSWGYRTKITINDSEVDSNLTNFPVYVNLANLPAGFHTNVKSAGADIRVTTSDMTTEIAREVVFYDAATDTGELHFKAPTVNGSSNTDFYIYYGNPGASDYAATDTYGRNAVWSVYDAVYHFGGTSLATTDSKGTYNLTAVNTPTGTAGKLAGQGSNHVSASSQYYYNNLSTAYGTSAKSMSMWFKTSTTGQSQGIWSKRVGTDYMQACIFLASDTGGTAGQQVAGSDVGVGIVQRSAISPLGYADGNWHLAHYVRDSVSTRVYVDGVLRNTATASIPNNTNTALHFIGGLNDGSSPIGGFYMNGQLDEGRLYSGALSNDWIDAEYSNQNAPTTFYTVGSQEAYAPSLNSTKFFMLLR